MLVVVIALFITVNIANECILFTWKTSRAYDKYNYLITFYVDGRVDNGANSPSSICDMWKVQ